MAVVHDDLPPAVLAGLDGGVRGDDAVVIARETAGRFIGSAMFDTRIVPGQSIIMRGLRAILCAPMLIQDRLVGVVYVDTSMRSGNLSSGSRGPQLRSVRVASGASHRSSQEMPTPRGLVADPPLDDVGIMQADVLTRVADVQKAVRAGGRVAQPLTTYLQDPCPERFAQWAHQCLANPAHLISFDIETHYKLDRCTPHHLCLELHQSLLQEDI